MAEIIELRRGASGLDDQVFSAVCELEVDLRAIDEFADALALVSETMDESPHANAINGLTWEIRAPGAQRDGAAIFLNSHIRTDPDKQSERQKASDALSILQAAANKGTADRV